MSGMNSSPKVILVTFLYQIMKIRSRFLLWLRLTFKITLNQWKVIMGQLWLFGHLSYLWVSWIFTVSKANPRWHNYTDYLYHSFCFVQDKCFMFLLCLLVFDTGIFYGYTNLVCCLLYNFWWGVWYISSSWWGNLVSYLVRGYALFFFSQVIFGFTSSLTVKFAYRFVQWECWEVDSSHCLLLSMSALFHPH